MKKLLILSAISSVAISAHATRIPDIAVTTPIKPISTVTAVVPVSVPVNVPVNIAPVVPVSAGATASALSRSAASSTSGASAFSSNGPVNASGGAGGSASGGSVNINQQRAAATAYAPSIVHSGGADSCMGSSSGGVQGLSLGVSVGSTWRDEHCEMLRDAVRLNEIGARETAYARMCADAKLRQAFELSGEFNCATGKLKAQPAPIIIEKEVVKTVEVVKEVPVVKTIEVASKCTPKTSTPTKVSPKPTRKICN